MIAVFVTKNEFDIVRLSSGDWENNTKNKQSKPVNKRNEPVMIHKYKDFGNLKILVVECTPDETNKIDALKNTPDEIRLMVFCEFVDEHIKKIGWSTDSVCVFTHFGGNTEDQDLFLLRELASCHGASQNLQSRFGQWEFLPFSTTNSLPEDLEISRESGGSISRVTIPTGNTFAKMLANARMSVYFHLFRKLSKKSNEIKREIDGDPSLQDKLLKGCSAHTEWKSCVKDSHGNVSFSKYERDEYAKNENLAKLCEDIQKSPDDFAVSDVNKISTDLGKLLETPPKEFNTELCNVCVGDGGQSSKQPTTSAPCTNSRDMIPLFNKRGFPVLSFVAVVVLSIVFAWATIIPIVSMKQNYRKIVSVCHEVTKEKIITKEKPASSETIVEKWQSVPAPVIIGVVMSCGIYLIGYIALLSVLHSTCRRFRQACALNEMADLYRDIVTITEDLDDQKTCRRNFANKMMDTYFDKSQG